MAHPGFGAAPHYYRYPQGGAPARQEQDDTSRMTNLYHKIGQLDPERTFPLDFVHILVKAAMRDPVVILDLDIAIQHQHLPAPHRGSSMAASRMHTPLRPRRTYRTNPPGTSLATLNTCNPVPLAPVASGQKRAAVNQPSMPPPAPTALQDTRAGSVASDLDDSLFVRSDDEEGEEKDDIKDEEAIEDEPPEPREKPVNYDKLLETTKRDLGWYGKYERCTERGEKGLAVSACHSIGQRLGRLENAMKRHQSYANRLHVLTVMRDMLHSCYATRASRVGTYVHHGFYFDVHFAEAVQAMTPGQRRKVRKEEGGKWLKSFLHVVHQASFYDGLPQLHQALVLLDPRGAKKIKPWADISK
ncbi:hypothetical protein PG984_008385 [Apiospora sp. TS-2023a]